MTVDLRTIDDVRTLASEGAEDARQQLSADATVFEVDSSQSLSDDQLASQAYSAVPQDLVSEDDYLRVSHGVAKTATTVFASTFDDVKRAVVSEIATDVNIALRMALTSARDMTADLEALASEIAAEMAKISVYAAAGALVPPAPADISAVRAKVEASRLAAETSADDLENARSRREAARVALGQNDGRVTRGFDTGSQSLRLRPLVPDSGLPRASDPDVVNATYAGVGATNVALQTRQKDVPGVSTVNLTAALDDMTATVADKAAYMAVCAAIAAMTASRDKQARAVYVYRRLSAVMDVILVQIGSGFARGLQQQIQEQAAGAIRALADEFQSRLDAIDQFLSLSVTRPSPLITNVSAVGQIADAQPLVDDLTGKCGLKLESFCRSQSLIEIAKALELELGVVLPRAPAFGRVRLTLTAPELGTDVDDIAPRVDGEAQMIMAEAVAGSGVVRARLRGQDVVRVYDESSLSVTATVAVAAAAGDQRLVLTAPAGVNIAEFGSVVIDGVTYRFYGGEADDDGYAITLTAPLASAAAVGDAVAVDREHRETFENVYKPLTQVGGGSGVLRIRSEREVEERLEYDSSSFDELTGVYTFTLSDPAKPAYDHRLSVIGRPAPADKKLLFKGSDLTVPAARFKVVNGNELVPEDGVTDPSTQVSVARHGAGGTHRLFAGDNKYAVTVSSVSATKITLSHDWHGQKTEKLTLSEMTSQLVVGSGKVAALLDDRLKKDLGVDELAVGDSMPLSGRIVVDAGAGTERSSCDDAAVANVSGQPSFTVATLTPLFRSDDVGTQASVGGRPVINDSGAVRQVRVTTRDYAITSVANSRLATMAAVSCAGTVSRSAAAVTGSGTSFLSEFEPGEAIYIAGDGWYRVDSVNSDTSMTLSSGSGSSGSGLPCHRGPWTDSTQTRSLSFMRQAQESRTFSAVKNVDGSVYELTTQTETGQTERVHGVQRLEITPGVQILPSSTAQFIATVPTPVTARFADSEYPPGTVSLRAEFEDRAYAPLQEPFVLAASTATIDGRELELASVTKSGDDVYVLTLSSPSPRVFSAGDVVEIKTTDIVSQLKTDFGDGSWSAGVDAWLSSTADDLKQLFGRLCLMLNGRPVNVAVPAAAVAASSAALAATLSAMKLTLSAMILGLPSSSVVENAVATFVNAGMDRAAKLLSEGDIIGLSGATAATSTSQGQQLAVLEEYKQHVVTFKQSYLIDKIADEVKGKLSNKEIRAKFERGFKENYKDEINSRLSALASHEKALKDLG